MATTSRTESAAGTHELVSAERLATYVRSLFAAHGLHAADTERLADYFTWVELHALPFLGVRRIPEYIGRLREGGAQLPSDDRPRIVADHDAFTVIDAGETFAQLAGAHAMERAVDKAQAAGACAVVVRNTTTAGALGYYAQLAARREMIGLVINNTPAVMAPWGGTTKSVGAQPFAVASPADRHDPLLLDTTNSAMSMARMHEWESRGEQLPDGVALAADGTPALDAPTAFAGFLQPMAGHRGYAIALMWEVLTGVLAGGARFAGQNALPADLANPTGGSMFLLALDPRAAMPYATFTARVDEMIDRIQASPPQDGFDKVRVPGERSAATARERREKGVPVPAEVVTTLNELGAEHGVRL